MSDLETPRFYLVFAESADENALMENFDAIRLREDMFIVYASMTRSEVYHAVRDLTDPNALMAAPLAAHPKFRGLAPGALKWLKQRSND
ncbi:hypothetical protein SSPSH_002648 [Salinisphaera shabanensis E1L3A]|jgi:hypothetical protein|uniref:Uncharacterized protein n=1 Tax=Salinisphaera shabanensis E1L3A TaxID=1033802 RepID=U2EJV3_9GAMM|nr:hypothetical protein [Salinisphaera shabanensis]ERJ18542.1 hypothetical protein SSPSH_002648 [Salinisphaera shabanensis E1L3A]